MSDAIDFNDESFESKYKEYSIIPKGSVLPMILYLERDKDNDDQATNIFKESSKDNDVVYINSKCIVTSGEYKGAALWNVLTVKGGQVGGDGKALLATDHPLTNGGTFANEPSVAADLNETSLEDALIKIAGFVDERGLIIALRVISWHSSKCLRP